MENSRLRKAAPTSVNVTVGPRTWQSVTRVQGGVYTRSWQSVTRVQSRVYRRGIQVVVYRPRVLKLRVQTTCSNRIAMPCHRAACG